MKQTNQFPLRTLGATGIKVTPIGLGAMELSHGSNLVARMFPYVSPQEKNAVIKAALDGGINWFDTAEMYGSGESERAVAAGLEAAGVVDEDVVVATKWRPMLRTARNIGRNIDDRQRNLGSYTIDNFMVHNTTSFSSIEDEMNAMADLLDAGQIRSAGVSNFNAAQLRQAHAALAARGYPLAVNQMPYSLINRTIERNGVLDAAKELGVTIVAYWPLESGLLTGKYHENPELLAKKSRIGRGRIQGKIESTRPLIEAMQTVAEQHGATVAQVALNWVISFHGETVVAIPGATKAKQAADNAATMNFRLTPEERARLDALSKAAAV